MNRKGFTLIELLIIIAIIGFLAAAILVAVDPVKRIGDSRDARRSAEANAILNAILTKQVDDREMYDGGSQAVAGTWDTMPIVTSTTGSQVIIESLVHTLDCAVTANVTAACPALGTAINIDLPTGDTTAIATKACTADLTSLTESGYIAQLPIDPACDQDAGCTSTAGTHTGYYIHREELGESGKVRIEIGACDPEYTIPLKVAR